MQSELRPRAAPRGLLYPHQVPWNVQHAVRMCSLNAVVATREHFSWVSRTRVTAIPTVRVQVDLTAPVKIHIVLIV